MSAVAHAAVTIGLPTISPEVVHVAAHSKGLTTAWIHDELARPLRVRVQRFDAKKGRWRRAGRLRDGGKRGVDLHRGDSIYSGRVKIRTDVAGHERFRLAVRGKGDSAWAYSEEFAATVIPAQLPIGPGQSDPLLNVADPATGELAMCDQVVVFFIPDTTMEDRQEAVAQVDGALMGVLDAVTWQVRIPCSGDFAGVANAIVALSTNGAVEWAEPNYLMTQQATCHPPDIGFDRNWALEITDMRRAWDVTVLGVPIAVIDTGINYDHEEFRNLSILLGRDYIDLDDDPRDSAGHGTAVAGVIAARRDDGAGTDGATRALILVERAIGSHGRIGYVDAAAAVRDATRRGVRVLNLSFGSFQSEEVLKRAIDEAVRKRSIVVAGAGNNNCGSKRFYPAALEGVIAVGATSGGAMQADRHWAEGTEQCCENDCGSNWGNWITLYAPGVDIVAPTASGTCEYRLWRGTSMSAPYVSAVVSMMLRVNSALSASTIAEILRRNADDTGNTDPGGATGVRRLNAGNALCAAKAWPDACDQSCRCDNDGDGVYDDVDECPDTTIPLNQPIGADGCTCEQKMQREMCDDHISCTDDTCVDAGYCVHQLASCDDGEPCTDDLCEPDSGECRHTSNSDACEDGNSCTNGDTCSGGICMPGVFSTCNNNGVVDCEEACDGFADAACPGRCLQDCTCAAVVLPTPTSTATQTDTPTPTPSMVAPAAWPMYGHDAQHSRASSAVGASTNHLRWMFTTESTLSSSPVVGPGGRIYIGGNDWYLYAINADGTVAWSALFGGPISDAAGVSSSGTIYVVQGGSLHALRADGVSKWIFTPLATGVSGAPVLGASDVVYLASGAGVIAVRDEGGVATELWRSPINGSPVLAPDGRVYAIDTSFWIDYLHDARWPVYSLYTIDPSTGVATFAATVWTANSGNPALSAPVVDNSGTIYVGGGYWGFGGVSYYWYGFVQSLFSDGTLKWSVGADPVEHLAVGQGLVYASAWNPGYGGSLGAVRTTDGSAVMSYGLSDQSRAGDLAIDGGGSVYFGTSTGTVYSLAPNGTERWRYQTGGYAGREPAIAADGTVYAASGDGKLYAFGADSGATATPTPVPPALAVDQEQAVSDGAAAWSWNNYGSWQSIAQTFTVDATSIVALTVKMCRQADLSPATGGFRVWICARGPDCAGTLTSRSYTYDEANALIPACGSTQEVTFSLPPAPLIPGRMYSWHIARDSFNYGDWFVNAYQSTGDPYASGALYYNSDTGTHTLDGADWWFKTWTGPIPTPTPVPIAMASYITTDESTAGAWKGIYGADGFNVINDTASYPSYVTVTSSGNAPYTWSGSTSDARALEKSASGTDRIAASWYSSTFFDINLQFNDANVHQVAVYLLDWDTHLGGRSEQVEVLDSSNTVLDTRTVAGFSGGQYIVWAMTGRTTIRVKNTGSSASNSVVSGIFFD